MIVYRKHKTGGEDVKMMRYGFGFFGGGFWLWCIMGILLITAIVLLIVSLVRHSRRRPFDHEPPAFMNALNILNERYARGEISDEEYARKKARDKEPIVNSKEYVKI